MAGSGFEDSANQKMKPAGRMPGTLTPRFAGLKAPPSPEVEAGPFPTTRGSASQVSSGKS
jgi:hypothetical protein